MKRIDKSILLFLATSAIGTFSSVAATQTKTRQAMNIAQNTADLLTKKNMMKFANDKNLQIPGTFKKIDDYACVRNRVVESVLIENGVTEIGVRAFAKCKNLKLVYIPNSIKKIGRNAFYMPNDDLQIVIGGTFQEIQRMYELIKDHVDVSQIRIYCYSKDANMIMQKYKGASVVTVNGKINLDIIKTDLKISSIKIIEYTSDIAIEIASLISKVEQDTSGDISENDDNNTDDNDNDDDSITDVSNNYSNDDEGLVNSGERATHTIKKSNLTKQIGTMINARKIDWESILGEYSDNDTVIIKGLNASYTVTIAEFKRVVTQIQNGLKKNQIKKGNIGKNLDIEFKKVIKRRTQITIDVQRQNTPDVSSILNNLNTELAEYDDQDIVSIDVNGNVYTLTIDSLKTIVKKFVTAFYNGSLEESDINNGWEEFIASMNYESDEHVANVTIDWTLKASGNTSKLLMNIIVEKYGDSVVEIKNNVMIHKSSSVDSTHVPSPTPIPTPGPIVTQTPAPVPSPVPNPTPDSVIPTPVPVPSPTPNSTPDPVVPTSAPVPSPVPNPTPDSVVPTPAPVPSPVPNPTPASVVPTPTPVPSPVQNPTPDSVVPTPAPVPSPVPNPTPDSVVPTPVPVPSPAPNPTPDPVVPTSASVDPIPAVITVGSNVPQAFGNIVISIPQNVPEKVLNEIKNIISKLNEMFINYHDTDVINVTFGEHNRLVTVAEFKFAITKLMADFNVTGIVKDNVEKALLKRLNSLEKARFIKELSSKTISDVILTWNVVSSKSDDKSTNTLDIEIKIQRITDNTDDKSDQPNGGKLSITADTNILIAQQEETEEVVIRKSQFQQVIDEILLKKKEYDIIKIISKDKNDTIFTEEIANQWYDENDAENKANYGVHLSGYTSIEKHAFAQLNNFSYIALDDVTDELPKGVFSGCSNLGLFEFSAGIQAIPEEAFERCTNLIDVIIPESINTIGESAFAGCSKLSKVVFKGNNVNIGDKAFSRCAKLTSLYIPDTTVFSDSKKGKSTPMGAFEKCKTDLIKVYIRVVNSMDNALKLKEMLTTKFKLLAENIFIEDFGRPKGNVDSAIESSSGLSQPGVKIRYEDVYEALAMRDDFKAHFIDGMKGELSVPLHLGVIGEFTVPQNGQFSVIQRALFSNWYGLNKVIIPNGYKVIEAAAFTNCANLLEAEIADSVEEIQAYTFAGCNKLRTVKLPKGLLSLEHRTFYECSSLESIEIPDDVVSIRSGAFESCINLKSVSIPTTVGAISKDAFKGCSNVTFDIRYIEDGVDDSKEDALKRIKKLIDKLIK